MKKLMSIIGIIGMILSGIWFITIIFIDLPGWIGMVPIGLMFMSVLYSDRVKERKAQE